MDPVTSTQPSFHRKPTTLNASDHHDAVLLRRFNEGDHAAFDRLVEKHYRRATLVAFQNLRDAGRVGEVVSAAFGKACQNAKSFRGDSKFSTWLHRIIVNCANDANRDRTKQNDLSLDDQYVRDFVCTDYPSLEDRTIDGELDRVRRRIMQTGLNTLTEGKRDLVLLSYAQGVSYDELAGKLGIPVGTVKSRLHRVRNQLQQAVKSSQELFAA